MTQDVFSSGISEKIISIISFFSIYFLKRILGFDRLPVPYRAVVT